MAQSEGYVKQSRLISLAQRVKTWLPLAVHYVGQEQQRVIEEYLLRFGRGDAMLVVLARVTVVPLETGDLRQVNHGRIL
jgi:hypothetical protein